MFTKGPESVVDRALAQKEAQELYKAVEKKIGTDESAFLKIMALRHFYQLRATFEEYAKVSSLWGLVINELHVYYSMGGLSELCILRAVDNGCIRQVGASQNIVHVPTMLSVGP